MNRPYLIMLPGWGMRSCIWLPIKEELEKHFHLLFVEWSRVYSIVDFKEEVIKLISVKQIQSFSLLGWSLGALVALDIASDYQSLIRHVILIGGTSKFTNCKADGYNSGWPLRVVERMKRRLQMDKEQTLLTFYNSLFSATEKTRGENKTFLQLIDNNLCNNDIFSLLSGLDYLIQMDLREKLKSIRVPVLLLHGEDDQICPIAASEYISRKVSGDVKMKVLPNNGHIPFFTNPDKCLEYIKWWIKDESLND